MLLRMDRVSLGGAFRHHAVLPGSAHTTHRAALAGVTNQPRRCVL
jgi:hypothetical protein